MSKFTFINNKVRLLVGTLVLLVLLGLLGVYTQSAQSARLEQNLAESQLAAASVQASDDAAIHFKIQVQEWKNLLLRGQDQASYARYLEAFEREHLAVDAALEKSRTAFEKLGLDTAPVHQAQLAHSALRSRYLEAIQLFDRANPTAHQVVDDVVRGIDRQLSGELNQLSGLILSALEQRAGETRLATVASQNFAYALSALIFMLAMAASFILKALVDENERIHRALRESAAGLRIYAEVIRSTGDSVIITDPDGKIVEINPAYQSATGRSREDAIGSSLQVPGLDPYAEATYAQLWRELKEQGYWAGEITAHRNDGTPFPCWALFNAVLDEDGAPVHYVCVMRDITRLKQNERQLELLAFHDALTGFPNRALLKDRLDVALAGAARQNSVLGVLCLDLDRFKYVNDTLGHAAGDRLLIEVSQRIERCLRSSDTLARMGGDEFTILLPELGSQADAEQIAQRIVESVGEVVRLDDESVCVGASIGISFYPLDGHDAPTMQKNADVAMYEAKAAGRGQYRVFSPEMLVRSNQRLSLTVQIDAALKHNHFSLVYQPMVNSKTWRPDSVEALIRWQKPSGEWAVPAAFIRHAEEVGLIKQIDCWVLEQACRDATSWPQYDGHELAVCVNLSALSMLQADMARLIKDILQRTGLAPARLNLEITENAVKTDPHAAQTMLEDVTSLGVSFSVNDFGTGYSSLSYLSGFPIKCLKLDRLFIDRIGKDKASEEVIQALLQLARKLDLRVVAEGVEQPNQKLFLANAGCEIMQGYHFVRPMPADQLNQWLGSTHRFAA